MLRIDTNTGTHVLTVAMNTATTAARIANAAFATAFAAATALLQRDHASQRLRALHGLVTHRRARRH